MCRQCRPWSDAAFCGVWSWCTVCQCPFHGTLSINGFILPQRVPIRCWVNIFSRWSELGLNWQHSAQKSNDLTNRLGCLPSAMSKKKYNKKKKNKGKKNENWLYKKKNNENWLYKKNKKTMKTDCTKKKKQWKLIVHDQKNFVTKFHLHPLPTPTHKSAGANSGWFLRGSIWSNYRTFST